MSKAGKWFEGSAFWLYHLFWSAVDWIYPPNCGGCNKPGERWCDDCQRQAAPMRESICSVCGNFIDSGNLCSRCSVALPPYEALRSWGIFVGPLRQAIHRLKYRHDIALGEALSHYLTELYQLMGWTVDIVIPVPLSHSRQVERGYNQSALLALPFALSCGLSFQPKAIQRIRNTRSQVGLHAHERIENVNGAFSAKKDIVYGKTILLVDDVTTTGATISSSAQALVEAGAKAVYGITLARSSFGMETDLTQATGSPNDQAPDKSN